MARTTKMSIKQHLNSDLQGEYFAIVNLAGTNPSCMQNRPEVEARWVKMIESITTVDNASKQTAMNIVKGSDYEFLTAMTSYYLGMSSKGITYNRYK